MKRELPQTIDIDDKEDANHNFLSQVTDAEAEAEAGALSSKPAAKCIKHYLDATDAREVQPQVKGKKLALVTGDDTPGLWPKKKSVGSGSQAKVVAAGNRSGFGGGSGGDSRSSSQFPAFSCPCGAGSCLVLTARTGSNAGQQFYRCPADPGSMCGYFKWCNDHSAVDSLPKGAGKVHNSFNYTDTKSHGTRRVLSCFKCGQGHWAANCTSSSRGSRETGNSSAPGSCHKCGKAGHLPKDCFH